MARILLLTVLRHVARVWQHQAADGEMSLETVDLYISTIERLLRFADAHNVTRIDDVTHTLALAFIEAPGRNRHQGLILNPANGTRRQRRSALESFFTEARSLGLTKSAPTVDLPAIPRDPRRPGVHLSDEDIQRLQFQAERGMPATRHATILALLLAGQTTAEIAKATTDDLDLAESCVWTDGATRTYGRNCPLSPWSLGVVELRADRLLRTTPRPDQPQPLTTGASSAYRAQASVCTGFGDIARRSGLATAQRRIEPKDVTRYVARGILAETGQLSEVARRLGLSSLDGAAALADLDWQPEDGQDGGEAA